MNDGHKEFAAPRAPSRPARKPVGLWILQAYFTFNAVVFAVVAAPLFTDASFAYRASTAVTSSLVALVSAAPIVATQRKWQSARLVSGVSLVILLGVSLFGLFTRLPADPVFDQRKPEIHGSSEQAGATLYSIAALAIPVALLWYVTSSCELRTFLEQPIRQGRDDGGA